MAGSLHAVAIDCCSAIATHCLLLERMHARMGAAAAPCGGAVPVVRKLVLPVLQPCKLTPEAVRSAVTESLSDRVEQKVAAGRDLEGRREQGSSSGIKHIKSAPVTARQPGHPACLAHTHSAASCLPLAPVVCISGLAIGRHGVRGGGAALVPAAPLRIRRRMLLPAASAAACRAATRGIIPARAPLVASGRLLVRAATAAVAASPLAFVARPNCLVARGGAATVAAVVSAHCAGGGGGVHRGRHLAAAKVNLVPILQRCGRAGSQRGGGERGHTQ